MTRTRRANGAGSVYTKHGSFYGRWTTEGGGHPNRLLGPVRLPGSATGLTRKQAERRLRELMDEVQVTTDVELTVAIAGQALSNSWRPRDERSRTSRRSSRTCGSTSRRSSRRSRSTG